MPIVKNRDWFGHGDVHLKWEPEKFEKWPWVPWRSEVREESEEFLNFYAQEPVFDTFVDTSKIPIIYMDYVRVGNKQMAVKEYFPHLSLYGSLFVCLQIKIK